MALENQSAVCARDTTTSTCRSGSEESSLVRRELLHPRISLLSERTARWRASRPQREKESERTCASFRSLIGIPIVLVSLPISTECTRQAIQKNSQKDRVAMANGGGMGGRWEWCDRRRVRIASFALRFRFEPRPERRRSFSTFYVDDCWFQHR